MKMKEFLGSMADLMEGAERLEIGPASRVVVMSDLHLGDGSRKDDSRLNAALVEEALRSWYLKEGYTLVLNGDIEELHKFDLDDIMRAHGSLYGVFADFAAKDRLKKLLGNHDLAYLLEKDPPFGAGHALMMEWTDGRSEGFGGIPPLLAFHGHQAATFFTRFNYLSDFIVRYLAGPLKIRNADVPMTSKHRFRTERRIYAAARKLGVIALAGHTHRPLFESMSKYDSLRFAIESLLRRYAEERGKERNALRERIRAFAAEFRALKGKERKNKIRRSLYAVEEPLVPCMFNSGCGTGRGGITALEIRDGNLALVHWTARGRGKPYIEGEARSRTVLEPSGAVRWVLAEDSLEYIGSRMTLLG